MPGHLTVEERDRIAQLLQEGASQSEIAHALGKSKSTVSRELERNSTGGDYLPGQAQRESERRRRERPIVRKMDGPEINLIVRTGLSQDWSPEQIAGYLDKHEGGPTVSHQTIYDWIEQSPDREHWKEHLRRRGKRPCRPKKPGLQEGACIRHRPEVIEQRMRLGDFEGDTVLGPPGTGGVATLVDRKSRFTIIVKVQSKNADHVHAQIKRRLKELDEERCHSITFDNGTEFARCYRLEKHLGLKLYFADPGCPYQRGTNENTNGLIRQYFPKGTDFRDISHCQVREAENKLNDRPRACLGFRTPREVFFEKNPPAGCD
jgi:IS30 family transposase